MPPIHQPRINRLIPSFGPIMGGIEVIILGSGFHPSLRLDCIFGGVMAGPTQRLSDDTMLAILPPRPTPSVVPVWFNGIQRDEDGTPSPPCSFAYTDEYPHAL